jgi:hypothetical protein
MGLYDYRPYVKKVKNNRQIMFECGRGFKLSDGPPGADYIKLFFSVTHATFGFIEESTVSPGKPCRGQCYKTFYARNSRIFVIRLSVLYLASFSSLV